MDKQRRPSLRRRIMLSALGLALGVAALGLLFHATTHPESADLQVRAMDLGGSGAVPASVAADSHPDSATELLSSPEGSMGANHARAAASGSWTPKCDGCVRGLVAMHPRGDGVAAEQVTVVVSVVPGELEPVDTQGFALTEEQNHSIFASRVGREARVKVGAEYELYGLAHGAWTLKGRSPGLLDYRNTILITDAEPSVRVDMEMGRRNVVRVALRDPDGSPFVKAIQKLNPDLYQRLSPFVCTEDPSPAAIAARRGSLETLASSSHYLLNPESDAWCDVEADLRTRTWIGVSLGDVRLAWTPLDPYQESVALTLAVDELKALLGALTVTVTDKASGSPLKGAVVNIEPNQGVARHVRTDERGTCEWKNQVAAPVRVWVGCEGYCREEQSLILRGGQRAEVSVELVQPVSLSGRLVDEQGRGIPGALRASWKDRDPDTGDATRTTVAKADGVFEFTLVHPGEYFIEADAIRLDDEQQEADETQPDAALRAYVDARFASAYGIVVKRAVQRKEKPH